MPRKVKYGVDYDLDYDVWHEYDHDLDTEGDGQPIDNDHLITEHGLWRCPICTFDNDNREYACEICGVFRYPVVNTHNNGNKESVGDMRKESGASILAQSLSSPLPHQTSKIDVLFQRQNDDFASYEANSVGRTGNILGYHNVVHDELMFSHEKHNVSIVPFKFDSLSPDDLVSSRKNFSSMSLKGNFEGLASSAISTSILDMKGKLKILPSTKCLENSSAQSHPGEQPKADESNNSMGVMEKLQALNSDSNKVDANVDSKILKRNATTSMSTLSTQYKPETWMLREDEGSLTQLNLAVVGHVDSGKSTLSGRLLNLLGHISQKDMHKYEKEARLNGKGSFAYAWALDESAEERERGITMTVAVAYFYSKKYHVVLLDSPGHKDFVPNMISGATQADAAILVIDASVGSFEAGMDGNGGQTREHAQLIRSFGVDQIIVAINKMDVVEYSKERFDFIKSQLGAFLCSCGFKDSALSWVPLSAMENQNLVMASSDVRLSSWYHGPYLLHVIDSLVSPSRDISKSLLMPICDVIKSQSLGQVAASGKLEFGALRCGLKVLIMPSKDLAVVRTIERGCKTCTIARAGDNVAVSLQGIDATHVMAGGVLCHPDFPVTVANHLELKVIMLDVATPILIGSQVEFHIHHAKEAAKVVKILCLFDQKTGKVSKRGPRCLTAKQTALIEVVLDGALCVEEFSVCRVLGRVFLRAAGRTISVGIVSRIVG